MKKIKKTIIISLSILVLSGTCAGLFLALRSDSFMVNRVEVESSMEKGPLTQQDVMKLAGVPLGRVSIFSLDLKRIEADLLNHEWIKHVRLIKKPQHTLNIFVTYRQPVALFQLKKGRLSYVDEEGKVFGNYDPGQGYDLPLLVGFNDQSSSKILEALQVYSAWQSHQMSKISTLYSIHWDENRGFRLLMGYGVGAKGAQESGEQMRKVRTMVDLGLENEISLQSKLYRLLNVFQYLGEHSIAVRQIWADLGKKVVVKTVSDS
jgi:cell division septal protein FtsQ